MRRSILNLREDPQLIQSPYVDYEDGFWAPFFDGADPTLRYADRGKGTYTRVGNVVTYHMKPSPVWKRLWWRFTRASTRITRR